MILNKIKLIKNKKFEKFFYKNIFLDIPCELIEGFKFHYYHRIRLPKSQNTFSAYSHFDNFNFKICFSEIIKNKKKVNILEHGGGLPHKGMNFDFEEKYIQKNMFGLKNIKIIKNNLKI